MPALVVIAALAAAPARTARPAPVSQDSGRTCHASLDGWYRRRSA